EHERAQALKAMDIVIQGMQAGVWGIVSGYVEQPLVAANIMEGSVRLYLNALSVYHDQKIASQYARRMIEILQPFAYCDVEVTDDNWFDSLTPPLLEQLGKIED